MIRKSLMKKKPLDRRNNSSEDPSFQKDLKNYINFLRNIPQKKETCVLKKRFFEETDRILKIADEFISKNNDKSIKMIKKNFRELLLPWMCRGVIVKRGYEKPHGYPGDYLTLEMIYNKKDISSDVLGKLFDRYLLEDPYVTAVRNRKEKMKILIRDFIVHSTNFKKLRILNIASGGARDLREFLENNKEILKNRNIEIVLVDQDKEALDFSKQQMNLINHNIGINYMNENIAIFFRNQDKFKTKLGKFEMIYSTGLIDYISDLLLEELIKFCFQSLALNGKLFFAVKNTRLFKSLASDWFCDWNFYLRDQKNLIALINRTLAGQEFQIQAIKGMDSHISFVSIIKRSNK